MCKKADENSNEKKVSKNHLTASFYGKDFRIHFTKDVIRVLGKPKYICIKVNKNMTSFLVTPCEGKMYMSFQVPENLFVSSSAKMRISSQGFILDLFRKNELCIGQTYRVEGEYLEKHNAVVFNLKKAALFNGQDADLE